MARDSRRGSFRGKVAANAGQQKAKATSYGHLQIPRGVPVFKEEGGERVSLDILPYVVTDPGHPDRNDEVEIAVVGSFWYRRPYKLHRNVGADNGTLVCPTSVGKKCPICEYRKKLLDEGANWKDDAIRALRASDRVLYYVQPKGEKKLDDKPHIWDISQFAFQAKLNDELEENPDYEVFPDLEEGLTLRIRFSEEKIGSNTFAETSRIDFDERDYKYDERDIEELATLDDVIIVKSYEEVNRAFFEVDDETEEEEPPRRERSGSADSTRERTRPRPADDDKTADEPSRGRDRDRGTSDRSAGRERETTGRTRDAERPKDSERSRDDERPRRTEEPKADPKPEGGPTRRRDPPRSEKEDRGSSAKADPKEGGGKDRCPHGHRFGKECDHFKECEECAIWSSCMDQMEAAE